MIRILLAEDDEALNKIVTRYLLNEGYMVDFFFDGESALSGYMDGKHNLVLTDIMMPKMDGFHLAKEIRDVNKDIPILFMTAKDDKASKLEGYAIGIDDYITKPFDMDVLLVKIKAILRRSQISDLKEIRIGNICMNETEHSVYINQEEVPFSVKEFDILYKLLSYPKKTFSRVQIMNEFWDYDSDATSRSVDVYMAKIRDKVKACDGFEIVTVHGLGYKAVLK